jgi:hypothetical protein
MFDKIGKYKFFSIFTISGLSLAINSAKTVMIKIEISAIKE